MRNTEKAQALLIMPLYALQHFQLFKILLSFDWIFPYTLRGEAKIIPIEQTRKPKLQDKKLNDFVQGNMQPMASVHSGAATSEANLQFNSFVLAVTHWQSWA